MNLDCVKDLEAVAERAHYRPKEMANLLGTSVRSLQRFIRSRYRQTPRQWLRPLREKRIRALLRNPRLLVKQVAAAAGYGNHSAFDRAFKARHRVNPRRFRLRIGARWRLLTKNRRRRRKSR